MKKFLALFLASAITVLAAPTQPTTPILNGKLLNPLNANGFRIDNLDTSNLGLGGGGGTPLTDLTLNVPVSLFSNPVNFTIVGGSVAGTMSLATQAPGTVFANATGSTATPTWVTLSTFKTAASLNLVDNVSDANKPISTATQSALDLKETISDHVADISSLNSAISLKASTTTVNTALGLKADKTYVDTQDSSKQNSWGTPAFNGYIAAGNTDGSLHWVDPVTLGTTSQTFTDGVENSSPTFTSATANFVAGDVGKTVTGDNIPAATTIASRTNSTTVVLSQAATATGSSKTFTIINRLEVGGTGTVTSVSVGNLSPLFLANVTSANSTPAIAFSLANVTGNTFYGNSSSIFGPPDYMTAATARSVLSGGNTVGASLMSITDPNALRYMRIKTDNTIELLTNGQFVTGVGAEPAFGNPASNGQVISSTTLGVRSFVSKENPLTLNPSAIFSRVGDTITLAQADTNHDGYLTQGGWNTFSGKENVLSFSAPLSRSSNSITLPVANGNATPPASGYLLAADWTTFNNKVSGNRNLLTTAPLTIDNSNTATLGGADRTLAILASSDINVFGGYLTQADHILFNSKAPRDTEATFTDSGTKASPSTWTSGATVAKETVAFATLDRYSLLPPANAYQPGRRIMYYDNKTILNFGRQFHPTGSTDTLNNLTASQWGTNWLAPFIAGGAGGSKQAEFETDGVGAWIQINQSFRASSFVDPLDNNKQVLVDVSPQTPLMGLTFTPASSDNSVSVVPQTAPAHQWFDGLDTFGNLVPHALSLSDAPPVEVTVLGTASSPVTPNDGSVSSVKILTALTALRSYTLPNATLYPPGATLIFYDATGNPNGQIARITAGNGNTVNGNTTVDVNDGIGNFFRRTFSADPAPPGNWIMTTVAGISSTGLSIAPFTAIPRSGSSATLTCNSGGTYAQENNILNLTTASTALGVINAGNGTHGTIKVRQDGTGGRGLTLPNGSKTTPAGAGLIDLTAQSPNQESQLDWNFDGGNYNFTLVGSDYTAAAAATYTTVSDAGNGSTAAQNNQANTIASKYLAGSFVACGTNTTCLAAETPYVVGRVELQLQKSGAPTYNIYAAIYADNGVAPPGDKPTTLVGRASAGLTANTALTTSEATVSFTDINATLLAGHKYWVVYYGDLTGRPVTDGNTTYRTTANGVFTNGSTTLTATGFTSGDTGSVITASLTGVTIPANTTMTYVNSTTATLSAAPTVVSGPVTGTFAIGSKVVTSASAAFTSADVGNTISGTGLVGTSTIATYTNGTTVTLSQGATASTAIGAWTIGAGNANNFTKWASGTLSATTFVSKAETGNWTANSTNRQMRFTLYK